VSSPRGSSSRTAAVVARAAASSSDSADMARWEQQVRDGTVGNVSVKQAGAWRVRAHMCVRACVVRVGGVLRASWCCPTAASGGRGGRAPWAAVPPWLWRLCCRHAPSTPRSTPALHCRLHALLCAQRNTLRRSRAGAPGLGAAGRAPAWRGREGRHHRCETRRGVSV
jgi:hypothetical protein